MENNSQKYISNLEIITTVQNEVSSSASQQPLFGVIPNSSDDGGQLIFELQSPKAIKKKLSLLLVFMTNKKVFLGAFTAQWFTPDYVNNLQKSVKSPQMGSSFAKNAKSNF